MRCPPCVFFLLFLAKPVTGQTFEDALGMPTARITLQEALHRVLERSLDVKIEWLNRAVADQQALAAAGKFNPYFYTDASYTDSRLPQNAIEFAQTGGGLVILTEPNLFRQQNTLVEMGFAGKLPTGAQYSVFTSAARFRNDLNRIRPPAVYYPEYATAIGITLTQPLLRDFGTDAQLSEIRVTRRNRAIADLKWATQVHRLIADVISEYFDLMFVVENVRLKQNVQVFVRHLSLSAAERAKTGVQVDLNPQDAELALSIAGEDVIKAMTLAAERQIKLKNQIFSGSAEDAGTLLLPDDAPRLIEMNTDREVLFRNALYRRPDYLATLEEIAKHDVLVRYMANQRLPRLDLQGALSTNSLSGSYESAYARAADRQGYEATIGLRFSVPIGNQTARANSATAEYLHQQAMLHAARSELNVRVEINTASAKLRGQRTRLESVRKSLRLAEAMQSAAEKRHADGAAGFGELLKARLQVTEARTRELEALIEHNRAAVQLALASGLLLEKYGIHLQDAPAPAAPPEPPARQRP